ncbi:MAG TPA: protein kinase [Ktedonobacterales bacterium]
MRWSDLIGMRVDQYQVIEEIGRGGAARVFRALDDTQPQQVAFKVLPIETDDRQSFMQRFKREAEVIQQLSHPNIVPVYGAGETDEFVYLALRLLEGGTLRQRIASERLTTQDVCQYMIQIALALSHAHRLGIIHRDVKPSNMLLDAAQPGKILLTDFGTAKIQNAAGLTKTGATVGTPEYMSPEQAEGREVDQRSDIYSMGCALYEALAGRPPFMGNTSLSVLYQQVHAQPTYIRSYNSEAPRELWTVLRKCLAKRPEERYGSAEHLAEALQPFAEGLIQPTPAPWHEPQISRSALSGLLETPSRPLHQSSALTPPALEGLGVMPPGMNGVNGQSAGGPIPLYLEGERAPNSRPTLGPRGPKPTVRLPVSSGRSGLLSASGPNASLADEQRQAVSDFAAQLDAEERMARSATSGLRQTARPAPPTTPFDAYPTIPTPVTPTRAPSSQPYRSATSGPIRSAASGPLHARTGGPAPTARPSHTSGPLSGRPWDDWGDVGYRAPNSSAMRGSTSVPVNMDSLRAGINPRTLGRRKLRRKAPALVAAAALAVLLVVGVGLGMGGMKLFARQSAPGTPTPHQTATLAPTATATAAQPTVTATPNPQVALNHQAASAFRAITIASFSDGSCSSANAATQFSGLVFINLCMARGSAPGPVTVQVRQNGAVVRTLISNLHPSSGASYTQGHTLSAGSYDMLVTMQINGKQAVAADIAFTVR